ncbi:hypothetical protein C8R42DRAFT_640835 [Lentinula raphanica]|nr:hypothetical protein C8R42DRAFT_640835 [Lentinula raphanica]
MFPPLGPAQSPKTQNIHTGPPPPHIHRPQTFYSHGSDTYTYPPPTPSAVPLHVHPIGAPTPSSSSHVTSDRLFQPLPWYPDPHQLSPPQPQPASSSAPRVESTLSELLSEPEQVPNTRKRRIRKPGNRGGSGRRQWTAAASTTNGNSSKLNPSEAPSIMPTATARACYCIKFSQAGIKRQCQNISNMSNTGISGALGTRHYSRMTFLLELLRLASVAAKVRSRNLEE